MLHERNSDIFMGIDNIIYLQIALHQWILIIFSIRCFLHGIWWQQLEWIRSNDITKIFDISSCFHAHVANWRMHRVYIVGISSKCSEIPRNLVVPPQEPEDYALKHCWRLSYDQMHSLRICRIHHKTIRWCC